MPFVYASPNTVLRRPNSSTVAGRTNTVFPTIWSGASDSSDGRGFLEGIFFSTHSVAFPKILLRPATWTSPMGASSAGATGGSAVSRCAVSVTGSTVSGCAVSVTGSTVSGCAVSVTGATTSPGCSRAAAVTSGGGLITDSSIAPMSSIKAITWPPYFRLFLYQISDHRAILHCVVA